MPDVSKIEESLYELEDTVTISEVVAMLANSKVYVSAVTVRTWCETYHIGTKIGGRYRVDVHKLNLLLKGQLKRSILQ